MSISKNIAGTIKRYKETNHLSIAELSIALGVAKSAVESYLNGTGNPRADTIEILAEKCGISAAEMISAQSPVWEQAEIIGQAARLFSGLPPEQRERATTLFLSLVDILSKGDHA